MTTVEKMLKECCKNCEHNDPEDYNNVDPYCNYYGEEIENENNETCFYFQERHTDNCQNVVQPSPNKLYNSPHNPHILMQHRTIDPLDVSLFEPSLDEVVHALPNINRYNGHTKFPYSVAQHCVNCMIAAMNEYEITTANKLVYILLHDASETYLQDLIRPIKKYVPDHFIEAEDRILERLIDTLPMAKDSRLALNEQSFQDIVSEIDTRMAVTEVNQLIPAHNDPIKGYDPFPILINEYSHTDVRKIFNNHLMKLIGDLINEQR